MIVGWKGVVVAVAVAVAGASHSADVLIEMEMLYDHVHADDRMCVMGDMCCCFN